MASADNPETTHLEPDALSFYRAIARQVFGDPELYRATLNAVLDHYIRNIVAADPGNPLHSPYAAFDAEDAFGLGSFLGALCYPDISLASPGAQREATGHVLLVICNAFNIQIVLWYDVNESIQQGSAGCPVYNVKLDLDEDSQPIFRSLIQDESGTKLIDYLVKEKNSHKLLDIKEISWWRAPPRDVPAPTFELREEPGWMIFSPPKPPREYNCYNEHQAEHLRWQKPDLTSTTDSLTVFTVSIRTPQQIVPALTLLTKALERAPAQEIPVNYRYGCRQQPLKRYIAIDAEFKHVALDDELLQQELGDKDEETQDKIKVGSAEELCTVLTVAVDRHLVLSFYLLDMLQHADETTAPELHKLYIGIIFNEELLKLWFNFQSDILVLDATIAHTFQGTVRPEYLKTEWKRPSRAAIATFKIRSPYLQGTRPDDVKFVRGRSGCELHIPHQSPDREIDCPCTSTSNVDITTILDFICLHLRYTRGMPAQDDPDHLDFHEVYLLHDLRRAWTYTADYYNYGRLLRDLMGEDRLYALLGFFKDVPKVIGQRRGKPAQDKWYTLLGPGMETDEDMMGYNIGDVVGIALLMRIITTTDDRPAFVNRLLNHDSIPKTTVQFRNVKHQVPSRISTERPLEGVNVALVDDYPRLYHRDIVGSTIVDMGTVFYGVQISDNPNPRISQIFQGRTDAWTRPEPYHMHEERLHELRLARTSAEISQVELRLQQLTSSRNTQSQPMEPPELMDPYQIAHEYLFDPTDFTLPEWFTTPTNRPTTHYQVFPEVSHEEDLRQRIINESRRRNAPVAAPRGFNRCDWMQELRPVFNVRHGPPGQPQPVPPTAPPAANATAARLANLAGRGGRGRP